MLTKYSALAPHAFLTHATQVVSSYLALFMDKVANRLPPAQVIRLDTRFISGCESAYYRMRAFQHADGDQLRLDVCEGLYLEMYSAWEVICYKPMARFTAEMATWNSDKKEAFIRELFPWVAATWDMPAR